MTVASDVITWGTAIALAGFIVTVIKFWMALSRDLTTARNQSAEAADDVKQLTVRIMALDAGFSLYRETIAREYINREAAREMEGRITNAIERLGDRVDRLAEERRH